MKLITSTTTYYLLAFLYDIALKLYLAVNNDLMDKIFNLSVIIMIIIKMDLYRNVPALNIDSFVAFS